MAISERKLRVNRRNALRSTGRMVEGKARSRKNALKHGLSATTLRTRQMRARVAGLVAAMGKGQVLALAPARALANAEVLLGEVAEARSRYAAELEAKRSESGQFDLAVLRKLLGLKCYEGRAGSKANRALQRAIKSDGSK